MSRLRVAMIAPPWLSIPPKGYGGIEAVLEALIPALMKQGVDVELFATGDTTIPTTKTHWLYETGQYEHIHKPMYSSAPIVIAHIMYAINHILEDGGFDIIHDHNGFLGPFVFSQGHDNLPPSVHTHHGPPFTTQDRLDIGLPDNTKMWEQFKRTGKHYLVGISDALMQRAPDILRPMILPTVHNAVIPSHFPFVRKKSDYFITLARFHPDKGQSIAVRACASMGKRLLMAGVIGDIATPKKALMELVNPLSPYRSTIDFKYFSDYIFPYLDNGKIAYVGDVSGKQKLDFIAKAKALLFPIQWDEPFGMAPIEALACGTPVIAMARGALPEIIEHGVNGFLAKDEEEFEHYMTRIDEIDPRACRASVVDRFSAATMAKRYIQRYRSVIRKTRPAKAKKH